MVEEKLTPEQQRASQNIGGLLFIFFSIYMFFKGQADGLASGALLIIGFSISKDIRTVVWFCIKWIFAKLSKKQPPTYDFSHAKINQHSGRDSIVNYGTVVYKK